jgi:endonuclease YncB( thermonuclease family)
MKQISAIFFLSLLLLTGVDLYAKETARVVRMVDGDTYVLRTATRDITVRLNNVDAPEMKQSYGFYSSKFIGDLIVGKVVEYDSTGRDIYRRVLANIWIDSKRLDSFIIRNGWAWQYVNYNNETLLADCMSQAIAEGKGLWKCGLARVCPPWLWRGYNARYKAIYSQKCHY